MFKTIGKEQLACLLVSEFIFSHAEVHVSLAAQFSLRWNFEIARQLMIDLTNKSVVLSIIKYCKTLVTIVKHSEDL